MSWKMDSAITSGHPLLKPVISPHSSASAHRIFANMPSTVAARASVTATLSRLPDLTPPQATPKSPWSGRLLFVGI
jgi:hypothetical protein